MATTTVTQNLTRGGGFLISTCRPEDVFTPADLTDDQRLIGQTAEEFVVKEVLPLAGSGRTRSRIDGGGGEESRRSRIAGRRNSGRIWRRGTRQRFRHAC